MTERNAKITIIDGGPYKVEPGCELVGPEGRSVEMREGKAFFLCRCGRSSNKPFCDGTHNSLDWEADTATG